MTRTDTLSPSARSAAMRAVKSRGTAPERAVAAALRKAGLSFRSNGAALPGRPDFVLASRRAAVFVHGCFWHGHGCARGARAPKTNARYWSEKIARNRARDARAARALRRLGWRVFTLWECRLKDPDAAARRIARALARRTGRQPGTKRPAKR